MKPLVRISTDGACSPNPGVGGWAAVLVYAANGKRARKEIKGSEVDTTNNRMEMFAALAALRRLKRACTVVLRSDSRYLCDGFNRHWVESWQRSGWKRSTGEPVKNHDLWKELHEMSRVHDIRWEWVRGHGDDAENNRCDHLAVQAREERRRRDRTRTGPRGEL